MKKIVRDFLLHSNTYLAFGTAVVSYMTLLIMGLPFSWEAVFVPFTIGFFIYTMNRYTDIAEDKVNVPERVEFFRKYGRFLLYVSLALYVSGLAVSLMNGIWTLFFALFPLIMGVIYSLMKLKRVVFLKNLIVGFAWGSTALLAASFSGAAFTLSAFLLFFFFSVSFFVNTIIFDIKDITGDKINNIITIPIQLGVKRTKYLCYAANSIAIIILVATVSYNMIPASALLLILLSAYIYVYSHIAQTEKPKWFYGIIVDGEFIFLFIAANIIISLMALI